MSFTSTSQFRFEDELKQLELAIDRLRLLLEQWHTCVGIEGWDKLGERIREEAEELRLLWLQLQKTPVSFNRDAYDREIRHLLEEAEVV